MRDNAELYGDLPVYSYYEGKNIVQLSYKDFYKDIAIKMDSIKIEDYFDASTFEYNANILWEFLCCEFGYAKKAIKIILKNFDIQNLNSDKNYDDYCTNIVIEILQDFVTEFPNSKLEFINED